MSDRPGLGDPNKIAQEMMGKIYRKAWVIIFAILILINLYYFVEAHREPQKVIVIIQTPNATVEEE